MYDILYEKEMREGAEKGSKKHNEEKGGEVRGGRRKVEGE